MSKKGLLMAVVVGCLAVSSFANAETTVTQYDNNISYSLTGYTNPFTAGTITITDGTDTITILDRNLGAISNDITSTDSYGEYFQWGNNDSKNFIITGAQNWTGDENIDLWGGSVDDKIDTLDGNNWKVNNAPQRQGPCPEGFHVPSYGELLKIQDMMGNNTGGMRTQLLIPLAGSRNYENGSPQDSNNAFWWSSSPYSGETSTPYSWGLEFYDTGYNEFSSSYYNRSYGFSLRCVYNNYSLYPDFVAKIGEIGYYSLDEALEAALEAVEHNDKIVVIRDITIDHDITINHDITSDYDIIIESGINLTYKSNINISGELKLDDLSQLIPAGDGKLIINDGGSLTVGDELLIGGEGAIFTLGDGIAVKISKNRQINGVYYLRLDFDGFEDISPITVTKSYTIDEGILFYFGCENHINLTINEPITVKGMIYAEFEHTTGKIITNGTGDLNKGFKKVLSIQGDVSFDLNNSLKSSMTLHDGSSFLLPGTGDFENGINSPEFLGKYGIISIVIEDGAIITLPVGQKLIGSTDNLKAIKDGYTFDGWFINEGLSIPFEFDTTYDTDITLYPKFTKIPDPTPTPSYSGGGGSRGRSVSKSEDNKKVDEDIVENKEENNEEDVKENNNNEENNTNKSELELAYEFAYKNGITTMDSIEKAELDQPLTRIAMAKMLSQYAMNVLGKVPANKIAPRFDDVTDELNEEYYGGSELAYQLNIMGLNIPDNKFRPFDLVSRAEFGTALSRLLFGLSDGEGLYYETHLSKLKEEGIITNDTPDLEEARGYIMLMLMRAANK